MDFSDSVNAVPNNKYTFIKNLYGYIGALQVLLTETHMIPDTKMIDLPDCV